MAGEGGQQEGQVGGGAGSEKIQSGQSGRHNLHNSVFSIFTLQLQVSDNKERRPDLPREGVQQGGEDGFLIPSTVNSITPGTLDISQLSCYTA